MVSSYKPFVMKIKSRIHGALDYATVLFLLLSPYLIGMPPLASKVAYGLGIFQLLLTLATDYEAGMVRLIPFRVHGIIELIAAIALVGIAIYLGNIEGLNPRIYYICLAVVYFATWLATDFRSESHPHKDVYL